MAEIDVTECPDCSQKGAFECRILIGGRGVYTCPAGHRWQNANEKLSTKGLPVASFAVMPVPESSGPSQAEPGRVSSSRVRSFSLTYACGVIDLASGFHPPTIGGSPRSHVCAWKAGGVLCEIRSWREKSAKPGPGVPDA